MREGVIIKIIFLVSFPIFWAASLAILKKMNKVFVVSSNSASVHNPSTTTFWRTFLNIKPKPRATAFRCIFTLRTIYDPCCVQKTSFISFSLQCSQSLPFIGSFCSDMLPLVLLHYHEHIKTKSKFFIQHTLFYSVISDNCFPQY